MKNYMKTAGITLLLAGIAVLLFLLITDAAYRETVNVSRENIILLNDIVKTAEENKNDLTGLDAIDGAFVIVDPEDHLLYSHGTDGTDPGELSVGNAIRKRYPYAYLSDGGKVWGTVILADDPAAGIKSLIRYISLAILLFILLAAVGMILYASYIRRNIIVPFRNMKDFASKVAQGRLDEPLVMDRDNMFGAFSESFDIMREELAEAKERELELQKKERELVASLSHDLKTPVTGIKLTAELMQMRLSVKKDAENAADKGSTEAEGEKPAVEGEAEEPLRFTAEELRALNADAEGIYEKAEQIDALLGDLFTSTLDDLGEFKVNCRDERSAVLAEIVKGADDRALVQADELPSVILNIDRKRMAQVIGNIISNSYKYADTQIDIHYRLSDKYLEMQIADHGPGVPPAELDLITNKFYRGKDWQDTDKEGHGLGLYIARTLMEKMNGDLIAESDGGGLAVTLVIPLS
ncbi:MAG: HAMP domain-containing histidine kinase [Lachnospiraceae bacterium]|nr:HAMP domain-containing histidine kinase [Lachnospiraceae bacterium]